MYIIRFINEARQNGSILVHCTFGASRSSAFILGYLIVTEKLPLLQAVVLLSSKHPQSAPAPWFMSQLCELEQNGLPPKQILEIKEEYQCKKCRKFLFTDKDLMEKHFSNKKKHKKFEKVNKINRFKVKENAHHILLTS